MSAQWHKYQPGDRVVVREDLKAGEQYYMGNRKICGAKAVSNVMALAGQTVTINGLSLTRYQIEETPGWFWTDGMFSGFAKEEEPYDVEDLL